MHSLAQYLKEYLLRCNRLQIQAQNIRKAIGQNPYFQCVSVFERFDKFRKGYLEPADFSQFMLENQVYPTESQLYLIFKDFDRKKIGLVTLDEFEEQLLPKENRKLRKDILARFAYPVELRLSLDLEYLLAKYFQQKIRNIKELNQIRDKVKLLKPYACDDAFLELDNRKLGYVTSINELDAFLRRNGKALSHQQLNRIYRVLSFQQNQEITMEMFREHMDPLALGCYPGYKQKIFEKQALEQRFLEKKYNLERSRVENIVKRQEFTHDIQNLRDSNRRLQYLIQEQELEGIRDLSRRYGY